MTYTLKCQREGWYTFDAPSHGIHLGVSARTADEALYQAGVRDHRVKAIIANEKRTAPSTVKASKPAASVPSIESSLREIQRLTAEIQRLQNPGSVATSAPATPSAPAVSSARAEQRRMLAEKMGLRPEHTPQSSAFKLSFADLEHAASQCPTLASNKQPAAPRIEESRSSDPRLERIKAAACASAGETAQVRVTETPWKLSFG